MGASLRTTVTQHYPVVIFHQDWTAEDQADIGEATASPIFWQKIVMDEVRRRRRR